jgi:hypothetical protein
MKNKKIVGKKSFIDSMKEKPYDICLALCCNDMHSYLKRRKDDQLKSKSHSSHPYRYRCSNIYIYTVMELILLQEKKGFVAMFERFYNYEIIVPTRRMRFYGMFEKFYYYGAIVVDRRSC